MSYWIAYLAFKIWTPSYISFEFDLGIVQLSPFVSHYFGNPSEYDFFPAGFSNNPLSFNTYSCNRLEDLWNTNPGLIH